MRFEIPYRAGAVIQISGRAANVVNQEGSPDLCPLTRLAVGHQQDQDFGVPGIPTFTLNAPGGGEVTLSQIGFPENKNVSSITSGTLRIYYCNELQTPNQYLLTSAIDANSTAIYLTHVDVGMRGEVFQIGAELLSIVSVDLSNKSCSVVRGILGSIQSSHSSAEAFMSVERANIIVPFAQNFFENRASINHLHSFLLPDARLVAAELFASNSFGDGQAQRQCYSALPDRGVRTLSGGQLAIQISGTLATQQNAAPPLIVQADHAVRDVRATLNQAAQGFVTNVQLQQDGQAYCNLEIASGATNSAIISGVDLGSLSKLSLLRASVTLQPVSGFAGAFAPAKDLTVTIRL